LKLCRCYVAIPCIFGAISAEIVGVKYAADDIFNTGIRMRITDSVRLRARLLAQRLAARTVSVMHLLRARLLAQRLAARTVSVMHLLRARLLAQRLAARTVSVMHLLRARLLAQRLAARTVSVMHLLRARLLAQRLAARTVSVMHLLRARLLAQRLAARTISISVSMLRLSRLLAFGLRQLHLLGHTIFLFRLCARLHRR